MSCLMIRGFAVVAVLCAVVPLSLASEGEREAKPAWPFFAFQNGMGGVPLEQQAELLKELGYNGIEFNGDFEQIPEMLGTLDAQGLKMFSIYTGACLDPGKPPYKPGLNAAIEQLDGRGTLISLFVLGGKPSSDEVDDRAVTVIREIAGMAEKSGLRIALYPHVGMYVARVEDGIRLAKKVDRKNVGVGFNLCHFLKLDDEKNLEQRLNEAMPYLFTVSINGADSGDTRQMEWNRLIQTLDRGSFDVSRMLKTLKRLGFTGPVGLQCYAIPGDPRENLNRSMKAWQSLCNRLAVEAKEGFTPIFNGKDLTGWEGEPGYWSVEEGAITGTTTSERPLTRATYLFWRGGRPADFELRAMYRLSGQGGNSGINFRSRELPGGDVQGYQADMETGPTYTGILYECNQRGIMTERGQKVVIAEDGRRTVTPLTPAVDWSKRIKPNDWNEYVIIAQGPEIILKINGAVASHVIDHQRDKAASEGLITLQLHPGPPMKVQYKNIRIKYKE